MSGGSLFSDEAGLPGSPVEGLADGAVLLRRFASADAAAIVQCVHELSILCPFRHMVTPGGYCMSVGMLSCGAVGWVTDRSGYRYQAVDPETGRPWPSMPALCRAIAARAAEQAGFTNFDPDCCLVNRYEPGARLSLHQDKDEATYVAPIVSVSLGLPVTFLFGGLTRKERPRRIRLESGDVVVWGGASRLAFHGVETLAEGHHPSTGRYRFNLTFRRALA
ncbi:MAG TPA: DNA oxidative demethylase AlkB [Tepidisphaeraceae bacterium]|jgi:alkylated DNA repair protein (DNA oxidative demethylase)